MQKGHSLGQVPCSAEPAQGYSTLIYETCMCLIERQNGCYYQEKFFNLVPILESCLFSHNFYKGIFVRRYFLHSSEMFGVYHLVLSTWPSEINPVLVCTTKLDSDRTTLTSTTEGPKSSMEVPKSSSP